MPDQWSADKEKSHIKVDNMTTYSWSLTSKRPSTPPGKPPPFFYSDLSPKCHSKYFKLSPIFSNLSRPSVSACLYFMDKLVAISLQLSVDNTNVIMLLSLENYGSVPILSSPPPVG